MAVILLGWAVMAVTLAALWMRQRATGNATSVDVAWSAGLAFLALLYPWFVQGDPLRRALVSALAVGWALRLAWYLFADRVLGRDEEDGRYRAMRREWGDRVQRRFFVFYQGQAAVAVVFSLPMWAAMQGGPPGPLAWLGVGVWVLAVAGETVADRQLARFRAGPENWGRVCRVGLWRYSRHPNYFFEWLHWWTYVLIGGGRPLTWLGPALMLWLLFKVTGIPHTEAQALRSRGDDYRAYQRSTSPFLPWPPRGES